MFFRHFLTRFDVFLSDLRNSCRGPSTSAELCLTFEIQQLFEKRSVTFTIEHAAALIRHSFDPIVEITSVEWRNKGTNCAELPLPLSFSRYSSSTKHISPELRQSIQLKSLLEP
jgi:hypothetical protein